MTHASSGTQAIALPHAEWLTAYIKGPAQRLGIEQADRPVVEVAHGLTCLRATQGGEQLAAGMQGALAQALAWLQHINLVFPPGWVYFNPERVMGAAEYASSLARSGHNIIEHKGK